MIFFQAYVRLLFWELRGKRGRIKSCFIFIYFFEEQKLQASQIH